MHHPWMLWPERRMFSASLGQSDYLFLPAIRSSKIGLVKSNAFADSLDDPGSSSMATKRVVHRCTVLALLVEEPLELPILWKTLVQPHMRKFHRGLDSLRLYARKLSSDSSVRPDFYEEVAEVVAMDLKTSTALLFQAK